MPPVQFDDAIDHAVEEMAVMGDHQQGAGRSRQVFLQPFDRLDIDMVGRFIKDQQVGPVDQGPGQGHAFALPAAEGSDASVEVADT